MAWLVTALLARGTAWAVLLASCAIASACGSADTTRTPAGVRALIVASGEGPEDARFVGDALAQYQLLRGRGLTDAEVTLVVPGWSRGLPMTERQRSAIDLATEDLDVSDLDAHLRSGHSTKHAYIYVAGHGDERGMLVGLGRRLGGEHVARALDRLADPMATVVVEACAPDSFVDALASRDDIALLTAAERGESSYATGYDAETGTWSGDEFTAALDVLVRARPTLRGRALRARLRRDVRRSQPQLFGTARERSLDELVPRIDLPR